MENATKALLIAATVLFLVMVLSLLMMSYNKISSHYQQEQELITIGQLEKFNKEFENYNRENIRGNELISLMNKIIDYNTRQAYDPEVQYERIKVNIHIGNEHLDEFKYEINGNRYGNKNPYIKADINNTDGFNDGINDKDLIAITNTSPDLIKNIYNSYGIAVTDTTLQRLSSEISNIIIDENDTTIRSSVDARFKRAMLLEEIFGWTLNIHKETGVSIGNDTRNKIAKVKDIANQYYQYTQFKRACFDCTEVEYDAETNRIVRMEFEVKTKNGKVIFD